MFNKLLILLTSALFLISCQNNVPDKLAEFFKYPPDHTRPWLYWYWIDENISKEGITKDLEAMVRVGIGQALIGHVSPGSERGNVRILGEEWWKMVEHAVEEGQRLGVDIGFFNGPGWSQSGGPWISKDQAMRHVVSREIKVKGPSLYKGKMPVTDTLLDLIAVQAFPVTWSAESKPVFYSIKATPSFPEVKNMFDNNGSTDFLFPEDLYSGNNINVDIQLIKPVSIQSIQLDFLPVPFKVEVEFQAIDLNREFQILRNFTLDRRYINFEIGPMRYQPANFSIPVTRSDHFRIKFSNLNASHGAGLREIDLKVTATLDQAIEKQLGKMYSGPLPSWEAYLWPDQNEPASDLTIEKNNIIDLTSKINVNGDLEWEVPEGDWSILFSGMVPTGATNIPVPLEATGYECDKFTREAIETHFDAFIAEFLRNVPAEKRRSLKTVVIDSYEVGPQNWTSDFKNIFLERYGYDPVPWLPVFNGRIVECADLSNRFLWDVRRLTADLISNIYVNRLRELCNEHGLDLWLENYGHWGFPAEFLQYGGKADKISGEFWFENALWDLGPLECRAASSAAHIYGKNQVFAEAFTAGFNFRQYPAVMKSRGDQMFCEGINHMVHHVYIHQPWEDRKPGVIAWFGMSYQRHNTWFEQSKAWNGYLKRCHFMLQQGIPVSDVCYFIGEDAPKMTGVLEPELPAGYDFDFINADVIMNRLSVKNGSLTLPGGKIYRLMVLPPIETVRPELLKKVHQLLMDGAVIYGPSPSGSPSLANYPASDNEIKSVAFELWGDFSNTSIINNKIGKGHLFYGEGLKTVFEKLNISPDIIVQDTSIRWVHRQSEEKDIYFISNQEGTNKIVDISFRISGKMPELWHPENGNTEKIALFRQEYGRTIVPLNLNPFESIFIVFKEPVKVPSIKTVYKDSLDIRSSDMPSQLPVISYMDNDHFLFTTATPGNYTLIYNDGENTEISVKNVPDPIFIEGSWRIHFPVNWDVPADTTFDRLVSWSDSKHDGIRYFSGTAVYNKNINIPEEMTGTGLLLFLSLGEVMVMAEVIVNGTNLGILWKEPYDINITDVVKKGDNEIEIRVTNTWWNRLVGDEKYPGGFPGSTIDHPRTYTTLKAWNADDELLKAGLLGPVKIYVKKQYVINR
jgi:hypothetical protein